MLSTKEWRQSWRRPEEDRYEGRRELIARAARTCFERSGVAKTSVADITREVSITRELFYYYFKNKVEVTGAVLDLYVDDAAELLAACAVQAADAESADALMPGVIAALRAWLGTRGEGPVPMLEILHETAGMAKTLYDVAGLAVACLHGWDGSMEPLMSQPQQLAERVAFVGAMDAMLSGASLSDEDLCEAVELLLS